VRLRVANIKGPAFFKTPAVGLDIDRAAIKAVLQCEAPGASHCSTLGTASFRGAPCPTWASHAFKGKAV
jgi:hypothetical protein